MFYFDWGFSDNPFQTTALEPNELGAKLIVGRNEALRKVKSRICNPPKLTTIEGPNGAGKTSVANIAAFQLYKESFAPGSKSLYLPCRKIFQLGDSTEPRAFCRNVLMEVAQTLVEQAEKLPTKSGHTKANTNSTISNWLNNAHSSNIQIGAAGVSFGYGQSASSTIGFEEVGFEKAIIDWLTSLFPSADSGGVVCVIDNLEILKTSSKAKDALESLRDTVFQYPGVRWVLCGARGIVHGVTSSPRLSGLLHRPVEVKDVSEIYIKEIYEARVSAFARSRSAELPVNHDQFVDVYWLHHGNLRDALGLCDHYCQTVHDDFGNELEVLDHNDFDDWMTEECSKVHASVRESVSTRALEVFQNCCRLESFSIGALRDGFGGSTGELRRPLKELETVEVLTSMQDTTDLRKKIFAVTPKGWLLERHLKISNQLMNTLAVRSRLPPDSDWNKTDSWSGETDVSED